MGNEVKDIDFSMIIAGRERKDALVSALRDIGARFLNIMYGEGSVKSSYLQDMLGFVPEENKVIIISLMTVEKSRALFQCLREKFNFTQPNTGIAFTIPVEGISKFGRVLRMQNESCAKALLIIVNAGFSDEVMEIARAEGATGATILNARGDGAVQKMFMGITVDDEKEIVLTLVDDKTCDKVMTAINDKAGVESPAHGVCFVLPVEKMTGLRLSESSQKSTSMRR